MIRSRLKKLRKTKELLKQRKRYIAEQHMPRFYVVETKEEAERITAKYIATGITDWEPLIVVLSNQSEVSANEQGN